MWNSNLIQIYQLIPNKNGRIIIHKNKLVLYISRIDFYLQNFIMPKFKLIKIYNLFIYSSNMFKILGIFG